MEMRCLRIVLILFFTFLSFYGVAQEDMLTQIEVDWKYKSNSESRWSSSLGSIYRSSFYSSERFDYSTEFLELNASQKYSIKSNHSVSLTFRYRIRELFDSNRTDERRIVQQYNHSHNLNGVILKGRLRVEQRFREKFTLRNRYRFGVSFPLNKTDDSLKEWLLTIDTEVLWSVTSHKSSTFDQRFTAVLEKPISKSLVFKLKPEYRYLDYTHDAHDLWRIYGILSISI